MGDENRNQHSVTPQNPDQAAAMNAMVAAAVKEAVANTFALLAPTLQGLALTPEKLGVAIREANRPYTDPAKLARELRESDKSKQDEAELQRATAARRAACPHQDANMRSSLCLTHNFPDRQPRAVCVICGDWIFPKEWRIAASEEQAKKLSSLEAPKGKAYVVAAHKDYNIVMSLESRS